MRLWHYDIIEYLPKSQLLGQWRELNSIYKKQDNHILINYIYGYDKKDLLIYSEKVIQELNKRGYRYNLDNYTKYFDKIDIVEIVKPFAKHHNKEYLTICYYNLKEKYLRGQKDFSYEIWERLDKFYKMEITKNDKN